MKLANLKPVAMNELAGVVERRMSLGNVLAAIDREDGFLERDLKNSGDMALANDSRFQESNYRQALTEYVVGWRDQNDIEATKEFIAPSVQVGRRFDYKAAVNAEEFLSETADDLRAIGSDFKRVEYTMNEVSGKTLNRGLMLRIDKDERTPGWEERAVGKLRRRILRNKLRRAVTLLSATAVNTAKTWSTGVADKEPDMDMLNQAETAADLSGVRPNRWLIGTTAWLSRVTGYRLQNTAGSNASAAWTEAQLAAFLRAEVKVSAERYQSAAAAKTQVVANKAIGFYAEAGVDTEDPSNFKDFYTPCDNGGQRYAVYIEHHTTFSIVIVEHYELLSATYTIGVRQLTIS